MKEPCVFCGYLNDSMKEDACNECGNRFVYNVDSSKENLKVYEQLINDKQKVYLTQLESKLDNNLSRLKKQITRLDDFLDICQDPTNKNRIIDLSDRVKRTIKCIKIQDDTDSMLNKSLDMFVGRGKSSHSRKEWEKFSLEYKVAVGKFEDLLHLGVINKAASDCKVIEIDKLKAKFSELKESIRHELINSLNLEIEFYYVDGSNFNTSIKTVSDHIKQNVSGISWLSQRFALLKTDKVMKLKISNYWGEVWEVGVKLDIELSDSKIFQLGYSGSLDKFQISLKSVDLSIEKKYPINFKGLITL